MEKVLQFIFVKFYFAIVINFVNSLYYFADLLMVNLV